jgi:non-ribosomal peptide synthase protein (TIGR01720 family)
VARTDEAWDVEAVSGPAPLTPIQSWFFEQELEHPSHFTQSVLLRLKRPIDLERLRAAVGRLIEHHDALRMRYRCEGSGQWRQSCEGEADLECFSAGRAEDEARLEKLLESWQASLELEQGRLLRVGWVEVGPGGEPLLFIAIHHLVVDGVSWRILLEDLETAYEEPEGRLPLKSSSYVGWARRLSEYAQSERIEGELDYWIGQGESGALPRDGSGSNTEADGAVVEVTLSAAQTRMLLQEATVRHQAGIDELLLAALSTALRQWTGEPVLIDVEGHGREELFEDVDVNRTVGWFTSMYPVLLSGGGPRETKRQLRAVPGKGIGYGLLRFLREDTREQLRQLPAAEVAFNYLGQMDGVLNTSRLFEPAPWRRGRPRWDQERRSHVLSINGGISGGQLRMQWGYSKNLHRRDTIAAVANRFQRALEQIIEGRQAPDDLTPSDFPLADLSENDLKEIMARFTTSAH